MVVLQGEIYWIDLGYSSGSSPGFKHPHVVVQNNIYNKSLIRTTVVCQITSYLKRALAPGNVRLRKGEGNLTKESVVNVTQILTVDKSDLIEKIGTLSQNRVWEIIQGIKQLLSPTEINSL
ncbi:type II toxin-antitoxin system PemK/MazF family toxin [bacterium]|nr:type II toxin-antitoxin system PemK/MazF family toxin [bacterium]